MVLTMSHFTILCCLLALLHTTCVALHVDDLNDVQIFYQYCDGSSWPRTNWDFDNISCSSMGITCNADERIVSLDLHDNDMECAFDGFNSQLISGDVPAVWNLSNNNIDNVEFLVFVDNPRFLTVDISFNKVHSLPVELRVKQLDLSGNMLVNMDIEVPFIRRLVATHASLVSFNLSSAANLEELILCDNSLTKDISDFNNFDKLTMLDLSRNMITGTLQSLSHPVNLQHLTLSTNMVSGDLSEVTTSILTELSHLDLRNNSLTGDLSDLAGSQLLYLDVSHNDIVNIFGGAPSAWPLLRHLDIGSTSISSGTFPADMSYLSGLEFLSLSDNGLSQLDGFPGWVNLTDLSLSDNPLSGAIPETLRYSRVERLDLSATLFDTIPEAVLSMSRLTQLAIRQVTFDTLPDLRFSRITSLDLSLNKWTDLPYSNMPRGLTFLNASRMDLDGSIPLPPSGALASLEVLLLNDNNLDGEVPVDLESLGLAQLSLRGNDHLFCPVRDYSAYAIETDYDWFVNDEIDPYSRCTCPTGYFIDGTLCTECEAGLVGNSENCDASQTLCCDPCPEGFFCEKGTSIPEACPFGFYCPTGTGAARENTCPDGKWTLAAGAKSSSDCLDLQIVQGSLSILGSAAISTAGGQEIRMLLWTERSDIGLHGDFVFFGTTDQRDKFSCTLAPDHERQLVANQNFEVKCILGQGYGVTFPTVVLLDGNTIIELPGVDSLIYPSPSIMNNSLRFEDGVPTSDLVAMDDNPNNVVYFDGDNFGFFDSTDTEDILVEMGILVGSDFQPKYTCAVIEATHTTIGCRLPESGEGGLYRFRVTITGAPSKAVGSDTYSFQAIPEIDNVIGCSSCETEGNERITFNGDFFPFENGIVMTVTVGGKVCEDVIVESRTSGSCLLPEGTGTSVAIVASHSGLFSTPKELVSYARPQITGVAGCDAATDPPNPIAVTNCPREGNTIITVTGENFGGDGSTVFIGENRVVPISSSHTELTFTLPEGTQPGRSLIIVQPTGGISINVGDVSYLECPTGQYQNGIMCEPCEAGFFSDVENSIACTQCPPGQFADEPMSTSCSDCGAGTYSANPPVECLPCGPGTFSTAETVASGTCDSCPAGQYQDEMMQTSCKDCPGGQIQSNTGQSTCEDCGFGHRSVGAITCEACPAGTFGNTTTNEVCHSCPVGQYQGDPGASACILCPAGQSASPETGSVACALCPIGTFSPTNGSACLDCEEGTISDTPGSTGCDVCPLGQFANGGRCELCPAGTFSNNGDTPNCTQCARGYHQPDVGQSECIICPAGQRSQRVTGSSECVPCLSGTFTASEGQSECRKCPPGQFSDSSLATGCTLCPIGFVQTEEGASRCDPCPSGYESRSEGSSQCEPCQEGYANSGSGKQCDPCQPGFFASDTNQTVCDRCSPGTFSSEPGTSSCTPCPVETFASQFNSTSCTPCGAGTYQREEGRSQCSSCESGEYLDGTGRCEECPETAKCFVADETVSPAGVTIGVVESSVGFWTSRDAQGELHSWPCQRGHCVEVAQCATTFEAADQVSTVRNCCGDNRMQPAHENPLCGLCAEGFYDWGSNCIECDSTFWWNLVFTVFLLAVVIGLFHNVSQRRSGATHIFFYFVQMISLYYVSSWLQYLEIFGFDVFFVTGESGFCLAPLTPFGKAIFNLVSPLFSFVMLAVILGVHYCVVEFQCCSCLRNSGFLKTLGNGCTAVVQLFYNLLKFIFGIPLMAVKWMIDASCCRYRQTSWTKQIAARIVDQFEIEEREDNRPEREKLFDSYVRTFGGLCMWSYNSIVRSAFTVFDCTNVQLPTGSVSVVTSLPAIECGSGEHTTLFLLHSFFGLIIAFGFPLALFLMYRRHYHGNHKLFELKTILRHGLLFERYKRSYFYYEVIVMARRFASIGFVVLITDRQAKFITLSFANLFFLMLHMWILPFGTTFENFAEGFSLMALLAYTFVLIPTTIPLSDSYTDGLSSTTFAIIGVFAIYFMVEYFSKQAKRNGFKLDDLKRSARDVFSLLKHGRKSDGPNYERAASKSSMTNSPNPRRRAFSTPSHDAPSPSLDLVRKSPSASHSNFSPIPTFNAPTTEMATRNARSPKATPIRKAPSTPKDPPNLSLVSSIERKPPVPAHLHSASSTPKIDIQASSGSDNKASPQRSDSISTNSTINSAESTALFRADSVMAV